MAMGVGIVDSTFSGNSSGNSESSAFDGMPLEETLAAAQAFTEQALAVNLDEVIAEPIVVAFREWQTITETRESDGKQVSRRKAVVRHAEIETYVPMSIFNKMIAMRDKLLRAQNQSQQETIAMMVECVWLVWKLTEPEMDKETLQEGLTFGQIGALFSRFFGDEIRRQTSKA